MVCTEKTSFNRVFTYFELSFFVFKHYWIIKKRMQGNPDKPGVKMMGTHTHKHKIIIAWCYIFNEHVLLPSFPPHVGIFFSIKLFFFDIWKNVITYGLLLLFYWKKKEKNAFILCVHLLFNFINFFPFIRFSLKILKIEFLLSIGSITSVVCPFFFVVASHTMHWIPFKLYRGERTFIYIAQNILLIVIKVIFYNNNARNIRRWHWCSRCFL